MARIDLGLVKGKDGRTLSLNGIQPDENGNLVVGAADVGAAPAGYVRGSYDVGDDDELDAKLIEVVSGMSNYSSAIITLNHTSAYMTIGGGTWFYHIDKTTNNYVSIRAYHYDGAGVTTASRSINSGALQPWEWDNPPMRLDIEYRTTERYMGKPVYTKLVDFGALPNATSKIIEYSTDTSCRLISAIGNVRGTEAILPSALGPETSQQVFIGGNGNTVWVVTYQDYTNTAAYMRVKYIKTTD